MPRSQMLRWAMCALLCANVTDIALAQRIGPPPTGGPPPAGALPPTGAPLPGLTPAELATFQEGLKRFTEIDSVSGTEPGASGPGWGRASI